MQDVHVIGQYAHLSTGDIATFAQACAITLFHVWNEAKSRKDFQNGAKTDIFIVLIRIAVVPESCRLMATNNAN